MSEKIEVTADFEDGEAKNISFKAFVDDAQVPLPDGKFSSAVSMPHILRPVPPDPIPPDPEPEPPPSGDYPELVAQMGLQRTWDTAKTAGLSEQPNKTPAANASQLPGGASTLSGKIITCPAGMVDYDRWNLMGYTLMVGSGRTANLINTKLGGAGLAYYVKASPGARIVCDRIEYDGAGRNKNYAGGFYLVGTSASSPGADLTIRNSKLLRDALNFMVRAYSVGGQTIIEDTWIGPGLWQNAAGDTSHFELHHTFMASGEVCRWERVFHDCRGWQGGSKDSNVTGYTYMEGTSLNWTHKDCIFLGFGDTGDASGLKAYFAFQMYGSGKLLMTNNIIQQDTAGRPGTFKHSSGVIVDPASIKNYRWKDGSLIVEEGLR